MLIEKPPRRTTRTFPRHILSIQIKKKTAPMFKVTDSNNKVLINYMDFVIQMTQARFLKDK